MKHKINAYALVRKNSQKFDTLRLSLALTDEKLPIYWNKKIAKRRAVELNYDVSMVEICAV